MAECPFEMAMTEIHSRYWRTENHFYSVVQTDMGVMGRRINTTYLMERCYGNDSNRGCGQAPRLIEAARNRYCDGLCGWAEGRDFGESWPFVIRM